jgi:ribosomal protein S5
VNHQERGVLVAHVPVARPGAAAESSRQSVSAFVVDRLSEVAQAVRVADYVATYPAPRGTGVTAEDAVAAVREVREAS